MAKSDHRDDVNFLVLIKHIIRWRKPILTVTIIAGLISVIVTMPIIMHPKFLSTVVFYPATSGSIAKTLLTKDVTGKSDVLAFGEDEDAEQLMQILESDRITNKIVEKYDLLRRYNINPNDDKKYTKLMRKYVKNITFRRNKHMAIEVNVMDEDPDTAALIANDVVAYMDSVKSQIQQERALEAMIIVEREYRMKEKEIKGIEDSLASLGQYGIVNYDEQATTISEAMDKARMDFYNQKALYEQSPNEANRKKLAVLQERLDEIKGEFNNLAKYGSIWLSLSEGLVLELEQFKLLKEKYELAKVDVEQVISQKFIVITASPAEAKVWPVRWVFLLISMAAAFIFCSVVFIIYENYLANKDWLVGK